MHSLYLESLISLATNNLHAVLKYIFSRIKLTTRVLKRFFSSNGNWPDKIEQENTQPQTNLGIGNCSYSFLLKSFVG